MKKIKTITGYAADARFWAETGNSIGYIPRQKNIPSPYAYSPVHLVFKYKDTAIIHVETSHRRYEVFSVPPAMIKKTENEILKILFP